MGRVRPLITPEGVALFLTLAETGERMGAFLLDLLFIAGGFVAMSLLALAIYSVTGIEFAATVRLLCFFLLRNFYFLLFELRPRAATPGKRILGIRVAARNGGRLTGDAILARNLMRELELFLPLGLLQVLGENAGGWLLLLGLGWAGIFTLFPLFNRERLRVGDMLAGTIVVHAPRRKLLADVAGGETTLAIPAFSPAQLGAYGIRELHVLEDVLRSRDPATLAAVAGRIGTKIGWVRGTETDHEFLQAFYAGLRGRLERGLLFGQRRRDKFDRDGGPHRTPPPLPPPSPASMDPRSP